MRWRLAVLALLLFAGPAAPGWAVPPKAHIGFLGVLPLSDPVTAKHWTLFLDALKQRGWVEGRNLNTTYRASEGLSARDAELAAELLGERPDVIVAIGPGAVRALAQRTKTIPIVMLGVPDPVAFGVVKSLARPGGNITGISPETQDLVGKAFQLLTEARPGISRVAYYGWANPRYWKLTEKVFAAPARRLGLKLHMMPLKSPADLHAAFAAVAKERPDALIVSSVPLFSPLARRIAAFAIKERLPTLTWNPIMVRDGLLMSYVADLDSMFPRAAAIVDKILRGERPADIPVEQPTKFDLVINLKTARAIGLKIPRLLRAQADELIR